MKRQFFVVIATLVLVAVQGMAQSMVDYHFRSTSSMVYSGSVYAAGPAMTSEGEAVFCRTVNGHEYDTSITPQESKAPAIRKIGGYNTEGTQPNAPIGDAVLPLLLLACAYAIFMFRRRAVRE